MNSKKQPVTGAKNQQRRDFIKKSTIVGAGVAAGALTGTAAAADIESPGDQKPGQKGYQLTQHVLDYYKSADV